MKTDPILLEVLRNRLKSIAEEMAAVTLRTAFTVFVKETQDFGACLLSTSGEVIAAPIEISVSAELGLPGLEAIDAFDHYDEGDIVIANDPDSTHGLSTHLPDIALWKPIFVEGVIIAYAYNFIHSSDVGGKVPGSISPSNFEIFQEGIRIPPLKLFKGGVLNDDVAKLILINTRIPEQNWGDIKALLASLSIAEIRVKELAGRYGVETVTTGISDLLDYAESCAREMIAALPDGHYQFSDYMEVEVAGAGQVRICLDLQICGTEMVLDFAGTDYQVRAAFNLPSWGQPRHYMLCFTIVNFLRTLNPSIPYNAGLLRPVELKIPRGTLLNPEPNAACGVRAATMFRVLDILNACLSQALPQVVPAASSGGIAIVLLSTTDGRTGERRISVGQPLNGGSGGRPNQDGIDGTSFTGGWLRNIPNEVLESDMPVVVEEYGYRNGSGGAGRRRGGCGLRFRLRADAPETVMTARGLERFVFRPYGLEGGSPGELYHITLTRASDRTPVACGKIDILELSLGDIVEFETSSGGGFGPPWERDVEDVTEDVRGGFVSIGQAASQYGVVLNDGVVDSSGTAVLRTRMSGMTTARFDLGPERRAYEAVWTEECQRALIDSLSVYPGPLRALMRVRVKERFDADPGELTPQKIAVVVAELGATAGLAASDGVLGVGSRGAGEW
jgi:N-methylhydantoinase B